jgi:hypothetical protein
MMIVPDAITRARAGGITGLLWAGWRALSRCAAGTRDGPEGANWR